MRNLDRLQPLALLVLRLVLGVIMIRHGYPKVAGGLHHHVALVSGLGLPGWTAYLSAAAEFLGGIALVAGVLTRLASLGILIDLGVAIWKVHFKNGLMGPAGYEFPLALCAIAFALIFFGAGSISLDSARGGGAARVKKK